jgi:hypothetical protein
LYGWIEGAELGIFGNFRKRLYMFRIRKNFFLFQLPAMKPMINLKL